MGRIHVRTALAALIALVATVTYFDATGQNQSASVTLASGPPQ
jgi:hypothetical protein